MTGHLKLLRSLTLAGGFALAACTGAWAAEPFSLTSSSFKDSTLMAVKHAGAIKSNPNCVGENVSPALAWANPPAGTKSYALLMLDPEGRNGLRVVHWLAYNIAASTTSFAEGETGQPSPKYTGGRGTAGQSTYLGPCTPPGTTPHHYTFVMIATDLEPNLPPGLNYDDLIAKLEGHAKGAAGLVGLFKHP
jgi:Raf kinase inhibitor-like YbhB/YbcL family protein